MTFYPTEQTEAHPDYDGEEEEEEEEEGEDLANSNSELESDEDNDAELDGNIDKSQLAEPFASGNLLKKLMIVT